MTRLVLRFAVIAAVFCVSVAVAGCGSSDRMPANAIAQVADTSITKADYEHWLKIMALNATGSERAAAAVLEDGGTSASCIAELKTAMKRAGKQAGSVTDKQLRERCVQQYEQLHDQTVNYLISAQWVAAEAARQGVALDDAELDKQLAEARKDGAAYRERLKRSGMTDADVRAQVRTGLLGQALQAKVTEGTVKKATAAQVKQFYRDNKQSFARPQVRDLNIVLTKTAAKGREAKQALADGQSFKQVAERFSVDETTARNGGVLTGVRKGAMEPPLDQAIFSAKKGELIGPVKTSFGWSTFEVIRVRPAVQQTLKQATPAIRKQLESEGPRQAMEKFTGAFQRRWKAQTTCREGFVTDQCANAPKAETSTTAAPDSTPTPTPPPAGVPAD